jgi:outer membrane lipoprotein LolB
VTGAAAFALAATSRRFGLARIAVLAVVASLFAACATLPPAAVEHAEQAAADVPFTLGGRLSAKRGTNGVAGGFAWTHAPAHDEIELSTPLGQTLAILEGQPGSVSVRLSDGRVERAPTWALLTERAFGVTIPVDGLAYWIRGHAAPGSTATLERDARGRVSSLRQNGWDIAYDYADDAASAPHRVTLTYPGAEPIEVRAVVDRVGGQGANTP